MSPQDYQDYVDLDRRHQIARAQMEQASRYMNIACFMVGVAVGAVILSLVVIAAGW